MIEDDLGLPYPVRLRAAQKETLAVFRLADAAYAPFSCSGTAECCQLAARKREPWLWPSEWELLRQRGPVPPPRADGGCPFLDPGGGRCTVYEHRPFGCRTFFCHRIRGPSHQPSAAVNALLERLERVNQRLDPEVKGPRPIREWLALSTE